MLTGNLARENVGAEMKRNLSKRARQRMSAGGKKASRADKRKAGKKGFEALIQAKLAALSPA